MCENGVVTCTPSWMWQTQIEAHIMGVGSYTEWDVVINVMKVI
jgi:hypothetical protein